MNSIDARFMSAALSFCAADLEITAIRRDTRHCTEMYPGDMEIGDIGRGPCLAENEDDKESWCEECTKRNANMPRFKAAIRERRLAKAKMIRAAVRMAGK